MFRVIDIDNPKPVTGNHHFMQLGPSILLLLAFTILSAATNSSKGKVPATANTIVTSSAIPGFLYPEELNKILLGRKAAQFTIGKSKLGRAIEAYFFPGTSDKRALVIGGMHGSELSSIEVANELMLQLRNNDGIYYNVIIIPSLFPDNAEQAKQNPLLIGSVDNIGRYSYPGATDPNRQMPTPGKPFDENDSLDHAGRKTENENALLLELIDQYRPGRIVNLHAIRTAENAGVYADPRTNHLGMALGFATDSSLAVIIARHIFDNGGYVPGNRLNHQPTALYYKDPAAVAAGAFQKRNMSGSPVPGHKGGGVSMGTWASTAVMDENNPGKNRDAIRLITMEFPGSKRPVDYPNPKQRRYCQQQIEWYAAALKAVFLGGYFVEDSSSAMARR